MRDKRPVDELSIEELERVLVIRKREERQKRLKQMQRAGRLVEPELPASSLAQEPVIAAALAPVPPVKPAAVPPVQEAPNGRSAAPRFEDEFYDPALESGGIGANIPWRRLFSSALVLVEVAAVAGLVLIAVSLFQAQQQIREETAAAQQFAEEQSAAARPTVAPTPLLTLEPVVLPGGHTPPTVPGGAQPNFAEIPESIPAHLLPAVQNQLIQPVINRSELRTPETAQRIYIENIGVDAPIVPGVDWDAMRQGVGRLLNGTNPGDERGNLVLSAHNDIYGEIFRHLEDVEPGMRFYIETETQVYSYEVTAVEIVEPTDVHVMQQTSTPTATLISCYPYQVNTHRIVVFAQRVDN